MSDEPVMTEMEILEHSLTNHTPTIAQVDAIEKIRHNALAFANTVVENAPLGREKSLAKTHIEEAVMWAVKAVVLG